MVHKRFQLHELLFHPSICSSAIALLDTTHIAWWGQLLKPFNNLEEKINKAYTKNVTKRKGRKNYQQMVRDGLL